MDQSTPPQRESLSLLDELRLRVPELHPYAALVLTLEPMMQRHEITSDEYLKWAAMLVTSRKGGLFSEN